MFYSFSLTGFPTEYNEVVSEGNMIEQEQNSTGQFLHIVNASAARKSQINRYIVLLTMLVPTTQMVLGGDFFSLVSLAAGFILVIAGARLISRWMSIPAYNFGFPLLVYGILATVGLVYIAINRHAYGLDFSHTYDDIKFWDRITGLASGENVLETTLFDHVMSWYYTLMSWIHGQPPQLLDLLPISWAFAALAVFAAHILATVVTKRDISVILTLAAVLGNCIFMHSAVQFHREGLMALLLMLSVLAAVKGQYLPAVLFAVLTGMVRGANGFIALLFILICYVLSRNMREFDKKIILAIVLVFLTIGVILFQEFIILRLTSVQGGKSEHGSLARYPTIKEQMTTRAEAVYGREEMSKIKRVIIESRGLSWFLRPLSDVFLPVTFSEPFQLYTLYLGALDKRGDGFVILPNRAGIINWMTILLWIWLGPKLLIGFFNGLKGDALHNAVTYFFLITLLLTTFVSMIHRHRIAFIILYPAMMSFSDCGPITKASHKRLFQVLTAMFILLIIAGNHRYWMIWK